MDQDNQDRHQEVAERVFQCRMEWLKIVYDFSILALAMVPSATQRALVRRLTPKRIATSSIVRNSLVAACGPGPAEICSSNQRLLCRLLVPLAMDPRAGIQWVLARLLTGLDIASAPSDPTLAHSVRLSVVLFSSVMSRPERPSLRPYSAASRCSPNYLGAAAR
jgi:hypothetical protein